MVAEVDAASLLLRGLFLPATAAATAGADSAGAVGRELVAAAAEEEDEAAKAADG